jgi:hypothetical protein
MVFVDLRCFEHHGAVPVLYCVTDGCLGPQARRYSLRLGFLIEKSPGWTSLPRLELLALEGGRQTHLKHGRVARQTRARNPKRKAYAQREQNRTGNEGSGSSRRSGTYRRGSSR